VGKKDDVVVVVVVVVVVFFCSTYIGRISTFTISHFLDLTNKKVILNQWDFHKNPQEWDPLMVSFP